MSTGYSAVTARICGQGPFVEVGDPTVVAVSAEVIAVGGSHGWPQWNGHDVSARSDRSTGWFPVGLFSSIDLSCVRVLTTRWEINSIAIHPSGRVCCDRDGRIRRRPRL